MEMLLWIFSFAIGANGRAKIIFVVSVHLTAYASENPENENRVHLHYFHILLGVIIFFSSCKTMNHRFSGRQGPCFMCPAQQRDD